MTISGAWAAVLRLNALLQAKSGAKKGFSHVSSLVTKLRRPTSSDSPRPVITQFAVSARSIRSTIQFARFSEIPAAHS